MSELKLSFKKYGCDKFDHGYWEEYEEVLLPQRFDKINILEVGIFKGTSMSAFLDYLPNAQIYGIDIFTRILPEQVEVLQRPRIHWLQGDTTRSTIMNKMKRAWGEDIKFDIIIDDGKHTPDANRLTFKNTIDFLKKGGIYYTEDAWPIDVMTDFEMSLPWLQRRKEEYTKEKMMKYLEEIKPYVPKRIDYREETGKPDSYLFKMRK